MTTLTQAPLIEAIFELKWGDVQVEENSQAFTFSQEDISFFVGQFNATAIKSGFIVVENINSNLPTGYSSILPHVISHRFRKQENTWPCYQIGLGIFTANQVNDGYDWKSFKKAILDGLDILDQGHPKGLRGLNPLSIELKYVDGFIFNENESANQFLKNKLNVSFAAPEDFLKADSLDSESFQTANFNFYLKTNSPVADMIIGFSRRQINGQEGYVMETIVQSNKVSLPAFNKESIGAWLEDAHLNQKHAFNTLIQPTFAKSFL